MVTGQIDTCRNCSTDAIIFAKEAILFSQIFPKITESLDHHIFGMEKNINE